MTLDPRVLAPMGEMEPRPMLEPIPFNPEMDGPMYDPPLYLPPEQPSGWTRALAPFAQGIPLGRNAPPLAHLIAGVLQGVGQARAQKYQQDEMNRQELNRRFQSAAAFRNRENLEISREQRAERGRALQEVRRVSEKERERSEKLKDETDPRVTPEIAARWQWPGDMVGKRWSEVPPALKQKAAPSMVGQLSPSFVASHELVPGATPGAPGSYQPTGTTNRIGAQIYNDASGDLESKRFIEVRDNYDRAQNAIKAANGFGDLMAVYAFVHVAEPGSIVRETEQDNARNAIGRIPAAQAIPMKWLRGDNFTPEGRQALLKLTKETYEQQKVRYLSARQMHVDRARAMGADPNLYVPDYSMERREAAAARAQKPAVAAPAPAAGRRRVVGPSGERGTVPANAKLDAGWRFED